MRRGLMTAGLCGVLGLVGCQEQKTVVVEQAQAGGYAGYQPPPPRPQPPPVRHVDILAPCSAPAGTGPFEKLPPAVRGGHVPTLERANAEHVAGCAGVRFRIGADGRARDITVMADYPVGYGFGQAGADAIADTQWAPMDDLSWRYLRLLIRPRPS